jgi:hypothetical protein
VNPANQSLILDEFDPDFLNNLFNIIADYENMERYTIIQAAFN